MLIDDWQMAIRITAALTCGVVLGINRDLRHKAAGVRTHGLVAIGSALAVLAPLAVAPDNGDAMSRVMQGLLTGIGFLGAGVIIHHERHKRVQGLTTAASIWVSSVLGLCCGTGHFILAGIALVAVLFVLIAGGPLERSIEKHFARDDDVPPVP
jgi:putative Mg2+ transporter-C (MgtC) family protein